MPLAWAAEASGLEACMSSCPVLMISVCAPIKGAPALPGAGAALAAGTTPMSLPPAPFADRSCGPGVAAALEDEQPARLRPNRKINARTARLLLLRVIGNP